MNWRESREMNGPIKVSQRWKKNDQGKVMTIVRKSKGGWWVVSYDNKGMSHTTFERDIYRHYTKIL